LGGFSRVDDALVNFARVITLLAVGFVVFSAISQTYLKSDLTRAKDANASLHVNYNTIACVQSNHLKSGEQCFMAYNVRTNKGGG
jgi:hypothetical protein